MPEFSNYVETRDPVDADGTELLPVSKDGDAKRLTSQQVADLAVPREFSRTFSEELIFDKSEIEYAPHVATGDLNFTLGAGGLTNQYSGATMVITFNGSQTVNFSGNFTRLYGITNGATPEAGNYEIYFLHSNGSVRVNFPGVSSESSGLTVLSAPANFAAVADGETAIDLSWDDVANESSYIIQFSLTGTGGWTELDTPTADATTSTHTGLSGGNTRYYRMKAIGDGVSYLDSAYTSVISAQTESGADVADPIPTFNPANGNAVWPMNKPITITMDEPVRNTDGTPITSNQAGIIVLKETNSGGANIAHSWTIDATKQIFTITPTTQYGENQLVYVSINNFEDVNGNDVTSAVSVTFTTTDYTFLNGTSNRLQFGDILDSVFAVNNTNFWLELTINNAVLSGTRQLVTKYDTAGNQRAFQWYYTGTDVYFGYVKTGSGTGNRVIKWTGALSAGEHVLVLKYDGNIDTNDGLDRVILLVDGATAGSKTLEVSNGETISTIFIPNVTAQLAVGVYVNNAGTPIGSNYYTEEAKDFIVRSSAGGVVEINVPNLKEGLDTSGNARHGTWV